MVMSFAGTRYSAGSFECWRKRAGLTIVRPAFSKFDMRIDRGGTLLNMITVIRIFMAGSVAFE